MASMQQLSWKMSYFLLPYVRETLYNFIVSPNDPDVGYLLQLMMDQATDPEVGLVSNTKYFWIIII